MKDPLNLVWIDLEMTGLDPNNDVILEIATIVTDKNLNVIATGPELAIKQSSENLDKMSAFVRSMHNGNGLLKRVEASSVTIEEAENATINFLKNYIHPNTSPLCGNSVYVDRKFLTSYMPNLEKLFHYRILDVSTIKEIAQRWYPKEANKIIKKNKHTALADIIESIDELKFYREHIFKS